MKKIILFLTFVFSYYSLYAFTLPKGYHWEKGTLATDFVAQKAQKGGSFTTYIASYPLTFRLYGPHANSGLFASYNEELSSFSLIEQHPVTRKFMPMLATSWAVGKDRKTVYFKLDTKVRWSDGKPVTSADYVFAWHFYLSRHIQSPYTTRYISDHIKEVAAIGKYIVKITARKPSWRLLYDLNMEPLPKHAIHLDANWVKKTNWKPNVVVSPYVLTKYQRGKSITFTRVKHWWGDSELRFKHRYNFDRIRLLVVRNPETTYALFKKGKLDIFSVSSIAIWKKQTRIPVITKGYVQKQAILLNRPSGISGIFFNLNDPILKEIKVRKALAHVFDFKTMQKTFLYNSSVRQVRFFDVYPPYKKMNQTTWTFSIKKANQLLDQAGWTDKRTANAIRTKQGKPLQVTITIGSKVFLKYLVFYKEIARKAGIKINIKLLDGAALFKSINERTYQSVVLVFSPSSLPAPLQFLDSHNARKGTNNLFMIKDKTIDKLISIYEDNLSQKKRVQAIFELENKIKEKTILIPFWKTDRIRLLWWRYIKGPKSFVTATELDWQYLWYDAQESKALKTAQRNNQKLISFPNLADPYKVKK